MEAGRGAGEGAEEMTSGCDMDLVTTRGASDFSIVCA